MKLDGAFNQQEFSNWIETFLPDFATEVRKVDVPAGFHGIRAIDTLGESKMGLRVFTIEMEGDPSKRKVGLATYSFSLLRDYGSPNALIAYYSTGFSGWRLSLLTSTLTWDEGKIKKTLSNPRRYSFVVGQGAKLHTPSNFLIKQGPVHSLDELKSRFSLDVVNSEFYKSIALVYTKLVGGVRGSGDKSVEYPGLLELPDLIKGSHIHHEFAVKLIGRIIFCWFLREKRSDSGIPLVPDEILSLSAIATNSDYYHQILEPLFFEVLNKPIGLRLKQYRNKHFDIVPYLNGGLFSPQVWDYYDEKYRYLLKIPDIWFKELFEILEQYHFTVDENTSVDIDLSIDPEMLGRIFENLLAEVNPETGESARKSTGSFYTPRVIVEYMVDESLILYLVQKTEIDERKVRALVSYDLSVDSEHPLTVGEKQKIVDALYQVTILDPACGSGAFPIGALQKIVYILEQIDPKAEAWFEKQVQQVSPEFRRHLDIKLADKDFNYIRKIGVIRQSIFGVDLQPIATEIARLRCFLTLVVEVTIKDEEINRGLDTLPNLDFKFVTANSLIGLPSEKSEIPQQSLLGLDEEKEIKALKYVMEDYFHPRDVDRNEVKNRFYQIRDKLFERVIKNNSWNQWTKLLSTWDPFSHEAAGWFDPKWMFGIDKFAIVIANPPYITIRNQDESFRSYVKANYRYSGGADLYVAFIEKSFSLISPAGIVTFICPNKFFGADYGKKLRNKLKNGDIKIYSIWDLKDERVFEAFITTIVVIFKSGQKTRDVYVKNKLGIRREDVFDSREKIQIEQDDDSRLIVRKIESFPTLSQYGAVRTGIMGFEYWKMEPIIRSNSQKGAPLLTNGNIDQFFDKWVDTEIDLYKKKYNQPRMLLDGNFLNENTIKLFRKEKIVIRGVARKLTSCIDLVGSAILVAVHSFIPFELKGIYYYLGITNSNLLNWYHLHTYYSVRIPQGSLKYPVDCISTLPIPDPNTNMDISSEIAYLSEKIVMKKNRDLKSLSRINELTYKLYGLTDEEIDIVKGGK